jgi:hypothetical protein
MKHLTTRSRSLLLLALIDHLTGSLEGLTQAHVTKITFLSCSHWRKLIRFHNGIMDDFDLQLFGKTLPQVIDVSFTEMGLPTFRRMQKSNWRKRSCHHRVRPKLFLKKKKIPNKPPISDVLNVNFKLVPNYYGNFHIIYRVTLVHVYLTEY